MLLTLPLGISAELLIVKQVDGKIVPLDESDADNTKEIDAVLLKYQWPMVKTSELTDDEKDELLTEGVPYAEELFIQKKIQEVTGNNAYQVAFIPTTIYELFVIADIFKTKKENDPLQKTAGILKTKKKNNSLQEAKENNPLQEAIKKLYENSKMYDLNICLTLQNDDDKSPEEVQNLVNNKYQTVNDLFYGHESAHSYINQKLTTFLFEICPDSQKTINGLELSNIIQTQQEHIVIFLIELLKAMHPNVTHSKEMLTIEIIKNYNANTGIDLINCLVTHDDPSNKSSLKNNIITKTIALEYEARTLNKALLIRGTSLKLFQINGNTNTLEKYLAGSTIRRPKPFLEKSLLEDYKNNVLSPYSISFGNSLFGGVFTDGNACAYNYLSGTVISYFNAKTPPINKAVGYVLLINKKDSINHNNFNLFFIAPMSTIASLLEKGEFFHSRTKAAVSIKNKDKISVQGIYFELEDPTHVILIPRDPLRHAALFSDFLAQNGRIIQIGNEEDLTPEEKQFVTHVIQNQTDAAKYYRAVETLKPWVTKVTQQWKEKKNPSSVAVAPSNQLPPLPKMRKLEIITSSPTQKLLKSEFVPKQIQQFRKILYPYKQLTDSELVATLKENIEACRNFMFMTKRYLHDSHDFTTKTLLSYLSASEIMLLDRIFILCRKELSGSKNLPMVPDRWYTKHAEPYIQKKIQTQ